MVEITHIPNSLETYPSVNVLTRYPVAPNKTANKGIAKKKVTKTEIIRIVSLL